MRLRRYFALPSDDRRVFRHAWLLLLRHRLVLMCSSPERVGRRVARAMAPNPVAQPADTQRAARWMSITEQAARHHVLPMNCLVRAFAGRELLARRGVVTRMVIGVARDAQGAVKAHAWLESGGAVVGDDADVASRFVAFDDVERLPASVTRWE